MATMRMQAPLEWSSTLSSGINDTDTTVTVASATGLPSKGFFYVTIQAEICLVTKVSGTTLTIVRAQEDTAAEVHSGGSSISTIVCRGTIEGFKREAGAIKHLPYGRIQRLAADGTLTTLTSSDFSLVNTASGSGTQDGNDGVITFQCRDHSSNDCAGLARTFGSATDWRITAHVGCPALLASSPDIIHFTTRQTTGGSMRGLELTPQSDISYATRSSFLGSPTKVVSHGIQGVQDFWARIEIEWNASASNEEFRYYYSIDGVHWWLMRTDSFAATSTQVGLFMTNITGSLVAMRSHIFSWLEEEVTF